MIILFQWIDPIWPSDRRGLRPNDWLALGHTPAIPRSFPEPGSLGKIITSFARSLGNQKRAPPICLNIQGQHEYVRSSNHVAFGSRRLHQVNSHGVRPVKFVNVSPSPLKLVPRSISQSKTYLGTRVNDALLQGILARHGLFQGDLNRGRVGQR